MQGKVDRKLDFLDQTCSSEASKRDFKTIDRDMHMMFIWKDKRFYGSNVDGLAEMYNEKLKGKNPLAIKNIFNGNIIPL